MTSKLAIFVRSASAGDVFNLQAHDHLNPAEDRGGLSVFKFRFNSITGKIGARNMSYNPPLALTVISSVSIGIAGVCSAWILLDIVLRRGWKSMMAIMYV